jgi:ribosomal protein S19
LGYLQPPLTQIISRVYRLIATKAKQLSQQLKGDEPMSQNTNQNNNQTGFYGKPVFVYTSDQAVEDGILFDVTIIDPAWKKGLFNYVTVNLLRNGYLDEQDKINIPNLLDLLNQSLLIVKTASRNMTIFDTFFSGSIELPNGEQQKVFIQQNETGKFTIMLPEDY